MYELSIMSEAHVEKKKEEGENNLLLAWNIAALNRINHSEEKFPSFEDLKKPKKPDHPQTAQDMFNQIKFITEALGGNIVETN